MDNHERLDLIDAQVGKLMDEANWQGKEWIGLFDQVQKLELRLQAVEKLVTLINQLLTDGKLA